MATSPHLHQVTRDDTDKEEVERIDEKSTYENEVDERGRQRNIFEGKHKFQSVRSKRVNKKIKAPRFHDEDIFKSGLAVQPENPYFVWRSTSPKITKLYLPKKVIDYYNLTILNSLSLVDEQGNEWKTKIIKWCDGRMACSNIGWKKLCHVNLIRIGDRCICEFIQGNSGLALHVRVIRARAHTLTIKKRVEEEAVEQADEGSTYESDCDENAQDGSRMQSTSGGKEGFEKEKCAKADKETFCFNLPNHNDCDENARDESRMEMNISKAKHKLKSPSSHTPVKRTVRKDETFDRRKVIEEEKIKQIDEETWKTEDAEQRSIVNQDAYIKELKGIIKTLISKDVNQNRVKCSCHKDDSNSSGSDIRLIDRPNSLQGTSIGSLVMMTKCLPEKLEVLQSYLQIVPEKANLSINLHNDVLGKKYKIYILLEDVNKFCLLESISDRCIISYMWYLHKKMKKENLVHKFRFVNPNFISFMSNRDQRARALADRLIGASTDQLVLAPCNVGFHWILTVIEPYNKTVFLMDPLSPRIRDAVWQDVVNEALSMFSASKGDNEKKSPKWVVIKTPLPPDSKQCGFYVMRYMKEIIETCRGLGSISLQSMFIKDSYSTSEIDEMRIEWAECVLDHIG